MLSRRELVPAMAATALIVAAKPALALPAPDLMRIDPIGFKVETRKIKSLTFGDLRNGSWREVASVEFFEGIDEAAHNAVMQSRVGNSFRVSFGKNMVFENVRIVSVWFDDSAERRINRLNFRMV